MEDRLRKFAVLVEAGSFTGAAERLRLSQPALSTSIQKLERELGAELFVRGKHPLHATRAGEAAYHAAKSLNLEIANLKTELAGLARQKPSLAIGVIDSIGDALFVRHNYLPTLEAQVRVTLSVNNSAHLLTAIRQDELDLICIASYTEHIPSIWKTISLGSEPLIAVVHRSHAKRMRSTVSQGRLPDFLSYNLGSVTERLISEHLTRSGLATESTFYSTSPEIMLQLLKRGRGVGVLPYLLVQDAIDQKELIALPISDGPVIERPIIALTRKGRTTKGPIDLLCKQITQLLAVQSTQAKRL